MGAGLAVLTTLGARAGAKRKKKDDANEDEEESEQAHQTERSSAPPPAEHLPKLRSAPRTLALPAGRLPPDAGDETPPPPSSPPPPWQPPGLPSGNDHRRSIEPRTPNAFGSDVLGAHPVMDADGREVYEVYQRVEEAR
jgi:hypothetical protein